MPCLPTHWAPGRCNRHKQLVPAHSPSAGRCSSTAPSCSIQQAARKCVQLSVGDCERGRTGSGCQRECLRNLAFSGWLCLACAGVFKFSGIVTTGTVVYLPPWVFVAEVVEHFAVRSFEANYADPAVMD